MENMTDYLMEQTQMSTVKMFELMKSSVTNSVEMLNWAQSEAQQISSHLTQQGAEQFIAQLEKLQAQQIEAQKEFQKQFQYLLNLVQAEGK